MVDQTGNPSGNVTKAQMLEYVEEYVGKRLDSYADQTQRGFDEVKAMLSEMRNNYVTKDVLDGVIKNSESDRARLWDMVRMLEKTTVPSAVHDVECAKVKDMSTKLDATRILVYKAVGATAVIAVIATYVLDRVFG